MVVLSGAFFGGRSVNAGHAWTFVIRRWRHKYVAVLKYVPRYGMEYFLRQAWYYQHKNTLEFLKAQLWRNPLLLDAAKRTHEHLDVHAHSIDRSGHDRIRPGKGPSLPESLSLRRVLEALLCRSMLPSSKGKVVDYEVEHTFRVVYEEDDQGYLAIPAYIEVTFWGFLEKRLNLVMRGWDKLQLLEKDAAAADAAVAAAVAAAAVIAAEAAAAEMDQG